MSSGTLEASVVARDILAIEDRLDLDSPLWMMEDFNVWPIYRMNLYRAFCVSSDSSVNGRLRAIVESIMGAIRHSSQHSAAAEEPHDVWLVSDGISFSALDDSGFEVERLCSPLLGPLAKIGANPIIIDREGSSLRRCRSPIRWLGPLTQQAKIHAMLSVKLSPDRRHEQRFEELGRIAKELGIGLPGIGPRLLDVKCRAVALLAKRVEPRMRQQMPKAVFLGSYYNVSGFAYLLAASRCGIPSIDIQHGVSGSLHVGYAGWNKITPGISRLLPKWFWTWTAADAAVIAQWADRSGGRHHAIVGGNPYVEAWKTGEFSASGSVERMCRELVADASDRPRILVTLQPGFLEESAISPLLQWWSSQPDVTWWCRLHPMAWADKPTITALLRKYQVKHWDVERASSLPLLSVLGVAQLHATHSSSTVMEAEQMGVPSVVWSRYGEELFADEISRGVVKAVGPGEPLELFPYRSARGPGLAPGRLPEVEKLREQAVRHILAGAG